MILYFLNRNMDILDVVTASGSSPIMLDEDTKTEDIETGISSFDGTLKYKDIHSRNSNIAEIVKPGNYVLISNENKQDFYQILDSEYGDGEATFYSEESSIDLINTEALIYPRPEAGEDTNPHTATWYVNKWITGTGWKIGINESSDTQKEALTWSGEQTVIERLSEIAKDFKLEIDYSFIINGFDIEEKHVNLHKKIGNETGVLLRAGYEISKLTVKRNANNLATALLVYGSQDESGTVTTLVGLNKDDGDIYTDGHYIKSRNALKKWGRALNTSEPLHITKVFNFDTSDKEQLFEEAKKHLQTISDLEVNYEADIEINEINANINIGDTISVADKENEIYLSARVLKKERSVINDTLKLTLGNHLINTNLISATLRELSEKITGATKNRPLYTWIAYADDSGGGGISLSPNNKNFIGIAYNKLQKKVDMSDPSVFIWKPISSALDLRTHYTKMGDIATFIAEVYLDNENVTSLYSNIMFKWSKKNENGEEIIGTGKTIAVNVLEMGYGGTIVCEFAHIREFGLLDRQSDFYVDGSGKKYIVRS